MTNEPLGVCDRPTGDAPHTKEIGCLNWRPVEASAPLVAFTSAVSGATYMTEADREKIQNDLIRDAMKWRHQEIQKDKEASAPAAPPAPDALEAFTEYFVANYPGPHTIITDPKWHAPKIFRAAQKAIQAAAPDAESAPAAPPAPKVTLGQLVVQLRWEIGELEIEVARLKSAAPDAELRELRARREELRTIEFRGFHADKELDQYIDARIAHLAAREKELEGHK